LKRPPPQISLKVVSGERNILLEGDFGRDPSKFRGLLRSLSLKQDWGSRYISLSEPLFAQMGVLKRKIITRELGLIFLTHFKHQTSIRRLGPNYRKTIYMAVMGCLRSLCPTSINATHLFRSRMRTHGQVRILLIPCFSVTQFSSRQQ